MAAAAAPATLIRRRTDRAVAAGIARALAAAQPGRPRAGAEARWIDHLGIAGDHRVPVRADRQRLAGRARRARACAHRQRRDACRLQRAAQPVADERALNRPAHADDGRTALRHRAHRLPVELLPAAIRSSWPLALWRVLGRRCNVCTDRAALSQLRRVTVAAGTGLSGYGVATRAAAAVAGRRRARTLEHPLLRARPARL